MIIDDKLVVDLLRQGLLKLQWAEQVALMAKLFGKEGITIQQYLDLRAVSEDVERFEKVGSGVVGLRK